MSVSGGPEVERALWALRAYDTTALGTVSGPARTSPGYSSPPRSRRDDPLVLAVLDGSRKAEDIAKDPRVAFMCSPGNRRAGSRGGARRAAPASMSRAARVFRRLVAHAPGARQFVDNLPVHPFIVAVRDSRSSKRWAGRRCC